MKFINILMVYTQFIIQVEMSEYKIWDASVVLEQLNSEHHSKKKLVMTDFYNCNILI